MKLYKNGVTIDVLPNEESRYLRIGWVRVEEEEPKKPVEVKAKPAVEAVPEEEKSTSKKSTTKKPQPAKKAGSK